MRLQDIMSRDVETIQDSESAEQAWNRMSFEEIRHLVVLKDNAVVGILSERDLGGKHGADFRRNKRVSDLMTVNPITASPRMTIKKAANEFRGTNTGCIPVLEKGELVGIVTITDLLEILGIGVERRRTKQPHKPELPHPVYRRPGHPPKK